MLPSNRTLVRDMDVRRFYSHRVALVSAVLLVRTLLLWASGADATSSEDFNNNTCVVSSPCELELGIAFGNPWLTVKTGDVKYFQVPGTPQLQPSEVTITLAYGEVEVYASSGGKTPTASDSDWAGNGVVRLRGWDVPLDGDTLTVAVNAMSDSKYRVLAASGEDVLPLENGLPIRMIQDEGEMRYFSIDIEENATDLLVSIDPYYGDPDMYMSLYELPDVNKTADHVLPNKKNFTWQSMSFGADTIHVQGEVLTDKCVPNPKAGLPCTYAVGVLAVSNSSYNIQASLRSGWSNLTHISLGEPHASRLDEGAYDYYAVSIPPAPSDDPWATVMITVTPTKGGLQNVYVTTDRTRQPGPMDYDVKGKNWAGSMAVMFSEAVDGFCADCTIYVGVFGYKAGSYSIVASQGLTKLREGFPQQGTVGGRVAGQYYEFFNPPGGSQSIQVEVTALTGDPDVYVTVGGDDSPGPHNFLWLGGMPGSDFVSISPEDEHFCQDCAYQMGVTSVSNSSYTISLYRGNGGVGVGKETCKGSTRYWNYVEDYWPCAGELSAVNAIATYLVPGRPQAGQVSAGDMRYYVVHPESDSATLTATLTKSHGEADLYLTKRETSTTKIDPTDESTFSWTSKGMTIDTISALGTEKIEQPYLLGVFGVTEALFSVVVTFSQGVALLQAGIPQRHFLEGREDMAFGFLVDQEGEDLQIIVTPLHGNPGLYVGMSSALSCSSKPDGDGEGNSPSDGRSESIKCRNWVWKSTEGTRRAIHISASSPCDPATPVSNSSTAGTASSPPLVVSDDCVPSSFGVGMMFVTVVAQDGEHTSFSVVASLLGKHVTLVPGIPQSALTSPMVPCGGVPTDGDGPCSAKYETSEVMQEALFVFRVGASSSSANTGFSVNLVPDCEEGSCGGTTCAAGCPRRPAKVYVKSCIENKCMPGDMYPSQGNAEIEFEVSSSHTTIFIADAPGSAGDGVFCIPSETGGQPCVFYLGVIGGGADEPPMHLTATVESPSGVSMVVPCLGERGRSSLPDGAIVMPVNRPPSSGIKMYEMCAVGDVDFKVTVETCRGKTELLVCDYTCPGLFPVKEHNEYAYMSTGANTCSVRPPPAGTGRPECFPTETAKTWHEVSIVVSRDEGDKGEEAVGGARVEDTFFVGVAMPVEQQAVDQEHVLRLDTLGENGVPIAATLSPKSLPSSPEMGAPVASRAFVGSGEASVEWGGATLHAPELSGVHTRDAEELDCADYCSFEVYAVPTRLQGDYVPTQCGLESVRNRYKVDVRYSWEGTAKVSGQVSQATLQELRDEDHDVYVVASCDFECLAVLMRMQCSRSLAAVRSPCQTQYAVFPPAVRVSSMSALTPTRSSTSGGGRPSRGKNKAVRLFILVMVVAGACAAGIIYARVPIVGASGQGSGGGWKSWSAWGGARSGRGRGAVEGGFELRHLGQEQSYKNNLSAIQEADEFIVGDTESGPGYANLLSAR